MAILLVRHGETPGNRNRIVQVPETELSAHGIEQATRLARRLAVSPIAEIWTSPQPRARMTAAAIESATGVSAREDIDLEERSFGAIRGTAYADLGFDLMAPDYDPPEGESWPVFHARVDRAWAKVERHWADRYRDASETKHLVVVSHGLVCRSLIERRLLPGMALDEHRDEGGRLHLRNTALTVIEPRLGGDPAGGETTFEYSVPLVGCVAHLDASEIGASGPV
jgi:2,3-bisphosphoglycerate-dependent phosphoglycerate mutase